MNQDEIKLVKSGKQIEAIRLYRARTGATLTEAKMIANTLWKQFQKNKVTLTKQNQLLNNWMNKNFFK